MVYRILLILTLTLAVTACGAPAATQPPATPQAPAVTEALGTQAHVETEPPAFQSLEAPTRQPSAVPTNTAAPTQIVPTRTDTPLPTLELPTEVGNPPARMVWDGAPTYPGESTPGYAFRVSYDPQHWALTTDQFGFPALGHRDLPGCVISVTTGRGLPASMSVEHEILYTGDITFDVGRVYENGALKFVTYTGGDGTIFTGFQVNFEEQAEECLAEAFTILSTLDSVPGSQATPTP
jgi:hypothetical protein